MFTSAPASLWNQLTEMVAFLFGDEDRRQAGIFGRYPAPFNPVEAITPPTFNTLLSGGDAIRALISGEMDPSADPTA